MSGPSGGASGARNNFAALSAPTATNDTAQGYSVGSVWFVPLTGDMWRARDVTAGAASWVKNDVSDHPGYVAGKTYFPFGQGAPTAGTANSTALLYLGFGVVKQRITVSQLGARVTTAAAGNFQLGIYRHNPDTGRPGLRVGMTGSISTATAVSLKGALLSPASLEPGNYWFGHEVDNGTAVLVAQGATSLNHGSMVGSDTTNITSGAVFVCGYSTNIGTFGTWPADLTGATLAELNGGTGRPALIEFLVQSVP